MWSPAFKLDAVPCPCAKSRNKLPDRCFSSGHVTAGLKEFEAMVPGCGSITSASAASMFFPGRAHWMTKSRALFDQWLKRHRLPTTLHPMFQKFCEEQWLQHVNMLEQTPRLNWAMLQKVKSTLHKDLVLYNEDHHPNHIVCFCPRFFLLGIASRRRELDCSSAPLIGQTLLCVPLGPSRGLMACAHDLLCLLISTIVQEPAPAGVQRKLRCPPLTAWDLEGGGRK